MRSSLDAVLNAMPLSRVYQQLTGIEARRVGPKRYRAKAVWRNGDGNSVSIDDEQSRWYDFVTHDGGRTLDLIARVLNCRRHPDALQWFLDRTGLSAPTFSPRERAEYRERHRRLERTVPLAKIWQHTAVSLTEELLSLLKAGLSVPGTGLAPKTGEIHSVELFAGRLRRASNEALVSEYERFFRLDPRLSRAMVQFGILRRQAAELALRRYLEAR